MGRSPTCIRWLEKSYGPVHIARQSIYFYKVRNETLTGQIIYISRNMKMNETDPLDLEIAASSFAALGSKQRLIVLRVLVRAGPAGLSIGALGRRSGVTGSTLTHHMKILSSAGLVSQTRQGRSIICAAVAYDQLHSLADFLVNACCADASNAGEVHDHG
jgi:ArsR family transcriptional regulator